jgi:integrase
MAKKRRRRGKGLGTVYRRGQLWSIGWVVSGAKLYEHGFPDEDTARRVLAVKIGDLAAGRGGLKAPKRSGPLAGLVEEWLKVRRTTHRAADQDENRWNNHLAPFLGRYSPDDVDVALLKRIIAAKLAEGLSPATVRLLMRLVSTLYSDLIDEGKATKNPARMLPKKTRALIRPTYDPKKTPFLEHKKDIARVYHALPPPYSVAFAMSALAGLRPGEVRALKWSNVDLERRRIYVRESVNGPTKDKDSREAPIGPGLHELLVAWREKNPRPYNDLVCPPSFGVLGRAAPGPRRKYLGEHRMTGLLKKSCRKLKLPELTFYEAGRHTFASQWVLNGGSIEKLREILGHSTVLVTERYAHLKPDLFGAADMERADVPLIATGLS